MTNFRIEIEIDNELFLDTIYILHLCSYYMFIILVEFS